MRRSTPAPLGPGCRSTRMKKRMSGLRGTEKDEPRVRDEPRTCQFPRACERTSGPWRPKCDHLIDQGINRRPLCVCPCGWSATLTQGQQPACWLEGLHIPCVRWWRRPRRWRCHKQRWQTAQQKRPTSFHHHHNFELIINQSIPLRPTHSSYSSVRQAL